MEKVYRTLAGLVEARANCARSGNREFWHKRHSERLLRLVADYLPSGSGIDAGTTLDVDLSTAERLVFATSFHHMNEGGYDGWTEHNVIVTPSLHHGIKLRITGRDRNEIKEYLHEIFHAALTAEIDVSAEYAKQEARVHG